MKPNSDLEKNEPENAKNMNILYSYLTKEEHAVTNPILEGLATQLLSKPTMNYQIVKQLGRGAAGTVYKIVDNDTNQRYAMKVIPVNHLTKTQQTMKLKEVLLMKGLEHPNIIHYISSYIEKDQLCIIMEFAILGDLTQVFLKKN